MAQDVARTARIGYDDAMTTKVVARKQNATRVANFYARAAYVIPKIALDARHAKALRRAMKRDGAGVTNTIRAAILAYAAPAAAASRPATRQARQAGSRRAAPARRAPTS